MSDEKSIDNIVHQIEALLANDMPYDVSLNDDELRGEIRRNKSFLLEGLKKGVSEERILKIVRLPSFWEDDIDAGKVWITGPNTGKGIGIAKLSKEYWKDLGKFENIYDVPYLKGILTLPEIDDETRERIIKQIDMLSDTMPILQLPEVMSKTCTVQDLSQKWIDDTMCEVCDVQDTKQKQKLKQEDDTMFNPSLSSTLMRIGCISDELIIVRWDEIDDGDYYGETRFCRSWEEAIEYMTKTGRKKYEIEIGVEEEGDKNE